MTAEESRRDAVAELLGALCYALLRVFQLAAGAVSHAPSIPLAERQAAFAVEEFDRYRILRERLEKLAPDPEIAMRAFRESLDAFYEAARSPGWLEAQVFHYVGNSLTTDFADVISGRLDDETAFSVRRALTGRGEQETFALDQIAAAIEAEGDDARDRVGRHAGVMVGLGLSRLREALLDSDALAEVLGGEAAVKDLVLELLGRHRERLERLGVDLID